MRHCSMYGSRASIALLLTAAILFWGDNLSSRSTVVRLLGNGSKGRLEVFNKGSWGAVCGNSSALSLSNETAHIICKELGFERAVRTGFLQEVVNDAFQAVLSPDGTSPLPGIHSLEIPMEVCNGNPVYIECLDNSGL